MPGRTWTDFKESARFRMGAAGSTLERDVKIFRWVLLVLAVLLISGGGYYTLAVLWPAQYARALLARDAELRVGPPGQAAPGAPGGAETTADLLAFLDAQEGLLREMEEKIHDLRPVPPRFRQLQDDLEGAIAWFRARPEESRRRLRFLADAKELAALVRQGFPSGVSSITLGQFLARYGPEIGRIQERGDALFGGELPVHPKITQLAAEWRAAQAALGVLLAGLRAQDPSLRAAVVLERLGKSHPQEEIALERFLERIGDVADAPLSSAIAAPLDTASAPPEVQAQLARVSEALNQVKRQYPQYLPD